MPYECTHPCRRGRGGGVNLSGCAAGTAAVATSTDATATTGAATPTNPAAEGGVTLPDQALLSTASR